MMPTLQTGGLFADLGALGAVRLALMGGFTLLLLYWTFERLRGEDEDPVLKLYQENDTGASSVLFSGTHAVLIVAVVVAALAMPWMSSPFVPAALVGIVVLHWVYEKREVRG